MKDRTAACLANGPRNSTMKAMAIGLAAISLSLPAPAALAGDKSKLLTEVHFNPGSSNVTLGGRQKIKAAIAAIKKENPNEIHVIGFSDSTGDEQVNRTISLHRADNVASLLAEHGITVPVMIEGKGENGAPYKIPDNVSEPLNRCVGIIAVSDPEKRAPL